MSVAARFSLADYDRMIAAGVFEPREEYRVELIRGEIREMVPIGPPHEDVVDRLNVWSIKSVSEKEVRVRVQQSIGIPGLVTAPEPDIVWAVQRDYSRQRPTADDVLLLIEVAATSLKYDTGEKAEIYAEAGIEDYWVVDLDGQVVEVHRNPDPARKRYRSRQAYSVEDKLCPLKHPGAVLRIAELW